jgi:NitT/TauT family transport system substrate-binding protein
MITLTRRDWIRLSTLALGAAAAAPLDAQGRPLRMLLNSGYSGANAFFLLAHDNGYFKEAGLDVAFTTGNGAFTAPERMMAEGFDVGYGDISALIESVSRDPEKSPVAVYMVFNATPSVLAVKVGGRVELPYDLTGRTLMGHPTDVALNTFRAFAALARIDPDDMKIVTTDASMGAMLKDLIGGKCDAVFGYNSTIRAAAAAEKIDADKQLRFFRYEDLLSDFYGSAIMVRRSLLVESPEAVRGLLRAVTRGLREAILKPDAAMNALATRDPKADRAIERARFQNTLDGEMAHPEGQRIGIGDFDEGRLATNIVQMVESRRLPRVPGILEVFNRDYLPPINERITSLGR